MIKPISPNEVKLKELPDFVIRAFNELLQNSHNNQKTITITQTEAVAKIMAVSGSSDYRSAVSKSAIFANHWLDVEDTYRKAGWKVVFDQPGYCESYEAFFKFTKE